MNRLELPELDNFYYTICNWDFYKDLSEEEVVTKHIEEDNTFEEIKSKHDTTPNHNKLENVPLKFSNSEDYIKIYYNLFLHECRSQIARSKAVEVK